MRDRENIVVLEFNELTPSLMQKFMDDGLLPNFLKFYKDSLVCTTVADERPPYLEPWIQWVTFHTGMTYQQHQVFHLNEGHKLDVARLWEVLADRGLRSWICGSMNVRVAPRDRCYVLPDPWCTKVSPNPSELAPFFGFVQQNVLEHTNDSVPLSRDAYLKFLGFMLRSGLSVSTVLDIGRQLISERFTGDKWKRVVLLDRLQCDVFEHYFFKFKPHFSTFFLNSTAHYQHAYWDSMDPEPFAAPPDAATRAKYENAILYGYVQMDRLIGRLMASVGREATLILATALSQQPAASAAQDEALAFYRPKRFESVAELAGIRFPYTATAVMTQQFFLEFSSGEHAQEAVRALQQLTLLGRPLLGLSCEGNRVFAGCAWQQTVPPGAMITASGREVPFEDLFYLLDTGKTGVHHPTGMLWIRTGSGTHALRSEPVPLVAVAPTILSMLNVPRAKWMVDPLDLTGTPAEGVERTAEAIRA